MKPRIPAFVCATGSWLTAICLVLPYPIYTTYIDLGKYLPQFQGVGICVVNLQDDMQEYLRGLFIALVVIDVAVLVVGIIYLGLVDAGTDMIPVYMTVRGALRLFCLPFNVMLDFVPSKGWKNKTFIALEVVSNLIELTIFGWLIYGTVVVSKRWPGSDNNVCNKPCYITAFSSIVIDWVWRLVVALALFFPVCWFASEQWTLALFFLYVSAKKSKKHRENPSVQPRYVLPLSVTAYLFVRMSRELQEAEGPLPVMVYDGVRARTSAGSHDFRNDDKLGGRCRGNNHHDIYEAELDVRKEKRSHRYLGTIATMFAICLCPLMVLRVAKLALTETYDNSGHFDITYTMFVWFAFLPTTTTPALYAAWRMSRTTKERLRGYFRFSGRGRSVNTDTRSERSEPPMAPPRNPYTTTPRSSEAGLSTSSNFNNS